MGRGHGSPWLNHGQCLPEIQLGVSRLPTFGLFDAPAHRQQRSRSVLKEDWRSEIGELGPLETEWKREALVVQAEQEVQRTQFVQH